MHKVCVKRKGASIENEGRAGVRELPARMALADKSLQQVVEISAQL